jgi:DNA-binding winged helix-turn-helix (wHTH) protein
LRVYEFGPYTLDVGERRLLEGDRLVSLTPKTFDMIVALVRRAGTLVSKLELLDYVWPDSSVEEGILAVHVSALRKAFRNPRYIETIPRVGYRFAANVQARAPTWNVVFLN